jgi:hypothetical protein
VNLRLALATNKQALDALGKRLVISLPEAA